MSGREEGMVARPADLKQLDFDMLKSPVVQSHDWGIPVPYDWQQAIWMALWQPGATVAARTCNESGKTSIVVPIAALAFAAAFPGCQVVITSASERQLEKQLMPTLENMIRKRKGWRKSGYTIYAPSADGLPPSEIVCFATKSGELFEGFHPRTHEDDNGNLRYCPLMIIADEAKSIKPDIFTAIERCNPTVELRISTCGEDNGGFYEACENEDGRWITGMEWKGRHIEFVIPWTDCDHLMHGHTFERKMALLQKKGPNDPVVRSILLAEFFRGGTHMVFTEADLQAVLECMSGLIPHLPGQRRAFCDLSGGGDELTFGFREGNLVHPIIAWNADSSTPPSNTADMYIKLFRQHGLSAEEIYCDNGGLGAQIINEMVKKGWNVGRVNFGRGAKDSSSFVTRIAELHWEFKEMCLDQQLILPNDEILLKQIRLRRYTMKNGESNCIALEDKKKAKSTRQEHSPDRLETVICLLIGHEQFFGVKTVLHANKSSLCGTPKEYMKRLEAEANHESGDDFGGGWGGA